MDTIPEKFETLQAQVEAMIEGTNPVVFFPSNTTRMPKLPQGFRSFMDDKIGMLYYNPKFINEGFIKEAISKKALWALLGFVQNKDEAVKGSPIAVTVRDVNSNEVKTAVVDSNNSDLVALQAYIFSQWFPKHKVETTTVFHIIAERIQGGENV